MPSARGARDDAARVAAALGLVAQQQRGLERRRDAPECEQAEAEAGGDDPQPCREPPRARAVEARELGALGRRAELAEPVAAHPADVIRGIPANVREGVWAAAP